MSSASKNHSGFENLSIWAAVGAGGVAAAIGGVYLVFWLSGALTERGLYSYIIKTNASLCIFLCGISLVLAVAPGCGKARFQTARVLAGIAAAVAGLTLFEHLTGLTLGIDQMLAEERPGALGVLHPNRMGPPASAGLTLCGVGLLLLLDRKRNMSRLVQGIGISICLISLLGILGHLYGIAGLYATPQSTAISWAAAASLFLLGTGLLLARAHEGFIAVFTSPGPGSTAARGLLVPAIFLPVLLGWLILQGEQRGMYTHGFGTGMLVLLLIVLFSILVYQAGKGAETALKAAEDQRSRETLRYSEQRLKTIIDNMAEGLIVLDPGSGSLQWNRKALEMYHQDAQAAGLNRLDGLRYRYEVTTLEGEVVPVDQWPLARLLRGEEFHDLDLAVRDLRGDWQRIIAFSGVMIRDEGGDPQMGLMNLRDITRRKEAEEQVRKTRDAVRESEEKFRAVFQQAAVGMGRVNFADARWVDVNDAFCQMLGYSREEILSIPWTEMTHPDDLDLDLIPFRRMAAGELETYTVEKRFFHKGGGHVWARLTLSLVRNQQGAPDYEVAIIEDISDRKKAEEALHRAKDELELRVRERTRQLEEAYAALQRETTERLAAVEDLREKEQLLVQQSRMAAMGEMLGNIAHQWRQPLNVLALMVQKLRFTFDKGQLDSETMRDEVSKAMNVIRHMSQTIDDFKDFLKEEKEIREFSVNSAVSATMALLEAQLKNANITVELDQESELLVTGHRNEFSHVVMNLITNARDALRDKEIESPKIVIRLFQEEGRKVVTITDNAGGVPDEIIGRIFDPYFTTKGPDKGTGIGLFMSKNIIEKNMHGRLSVRNSTEGAEFRIEL